MAKSAAYPLLAMEHFQQVTHISDPKYTFFQLPISTFIFLVRLLHQTTRIQPPKIKQRKSFSFRCKSISNKLLISDIQNIFAPLPIVTFVFQVIIAAAAYQNATTKNRVELHLGKSEVCFDNYQKIIGNWDWIDNLLEHLHHQNINFQYCGER